VALFDWVRDRIRYDPKAALDDRECTARRRSWSAAAGTAWRRPSSWRRWPCRRHPARLGFADVRNHQSPAWLREAMGTDVFVFHGYVELHLDGRWVKATPPSMRPRPRRPASSRHPRRHQRRDAPPVDPRGHPYIEYLRDRGSFCDLPFEEIHRTIRETYGGAASD